MALKSTERRVDELELNKQDTLVSGTNIKTINGNSVLGSGNLVISTASTITVGTTPVTSGTDGSILMQKTGKVENSIIYENGLGDVIIPTVSSGAIRGLVVGGTTRNSNMALTLYNSLSIKKGGSVWLERSDNTNIQAVSYSTTGFNLTIGAPASSSGFIYFNKQNGNNISAFDVNLGHFGIGTATPQARLDVRAQGALSTDIAFRVRNSADTANLVQFRGNGSHIIGDGTWGITINNTTANHLVNGNIAFVNNIDIRGNITHTNGVSDISFRTTQAPITSGYSLNPYYERFVFGSTTTAGFGSGNPSRFIGIVNGTAPNGVITDSFVLYSSDIVAGNAAPHFRTENGSIIKLFRGAALTASDGTLANAVTRIAELEARLQAHGLIA